MKNSKINQLEKISELLQNGVIERNEFEKLKKDILDSEFVLDSNLTNRSKRLENYYKDVESENKNPILNVILICIGVLAFITCICFIFFPKTFEDVKLEIVGKNNWSASEVRKFNYGFNQLRDCIKISSVQTNSGTELKSFEINKIMDEIQVTLLDKLSTDFKNINEVSSIGNNTNTNDLMNNIIIIKYSTIFLDIIKKHDINTSSIQYEFNKEKLIELIKSSSFQNI